MDQRSQNAQADAPGGRRGLPRNVVVLGAVSFFADISSEMIYPFVPLFLTRTLGAPVAAVGLIEGVAEGTASLLRVISGWWSDRVGRRLPLVFGGYGLATLGKVLLAVASAWPMVLLARFVDRFGKGMRGSPRDALIAESTPADQRGRAFGLHRAMDTAGAAIGPLLALALAAAVQERLRLVFLLAVIPGALSVASVLAVREPRRPAGGRARPPDLRGAWRELDRRLVLFLLASLVFALGNSSDIFLLLRASDLGLSSTGVVLAYVVYNFVYMGLAFPAGAWSDRVGRRGLFVAGLLVFAAVYAGFARATATWQVWPLFALYGSYIALTDGVGKALLTDLAPAPLRASVLGLYGTVTGVAALLASVVAGQLWDHVGVPAPFVLGAVAAASAAVLLAWQPRLR